MSNIFDYIPTYSEKKPHTGASTEYSFFKELGGEMFLKRMLVYCGWDLDTVREQVGEDAAQDVLHSGIDIQKAKEEYSYWTKNLR